MGGEDKENHIASPSVTQDLVRDGFDTSMSRLLQDFTSAELLANTPEMSKGTNSCSDSVCETVVNPMKHLHLRRPALTKRKKSGACSLKKKTTPNSLNIAIAACKFQRPIVWPARLSGHSDRPNSQILRPSRLLTKAEAASAQDTKTPTEPRPSAEKVSQSQNCSFVFGKASSVDYSSLSFSSLCEQATSNIVESSKDVEDRACSPAPSKDTGAGSVKPVSKRQSSTDAPPAKFARTYGAGNNPGTSQAVYLDYRMPGASHALDSCHHPSHKKSPSTCESGRTSNSTLCNEQAAAAAPSSLETLTTLRLALSSCGQSVSQASYSQDISLDETNANELASYLEDLLHIPRKMSVMAEMMYA